jgi:diguanylate cyclase (GGDEF)-like protein
MPEMNSEPAERTGPLREDLRAQVAELVLSRLAVIASEAPTVFPLDGTEPLDPEYCRRVAEILVQALALVIRIGRLESRGELITELHRLGLERSLSIGRLFTFVYLTERNAVAELAAVDGIGATSEPWPLVTQFVHRAAFDLLAAYADHMRLEPTSEAIIDPLTTLHTRPLFEAVLAKEVERAARYEYPLSLILFDVDNLSRINQNHGYGVGDKILERLGILVRTHFRQYDWVARYAEDAIAALIVRAEPDHATELAEHVRASVQERLGFTDHRTDCAVVVTLSAAAVNVRVTAGLTLDPERLKAEAVAAVERAKNQGRNRVERVDL